MFDVAYDPLDGLITCRVDGFLTLDDVRAHNRLLRSAVDHARRRRRQIRILILAFDMPPQAPEVAEKGSEIRRQTLALNPKDRLAYVFSASLSRLQAARTVDSTHERAFQSEPEARAWLKEEEQMHARPPECLRPG